MQNATSIMLILLLSACSTIFPNKTIDSRVWNTAECSGAAGWETCFRKADSICLNGYDMAKKQESPITLLRSFEFACKN